LSRDALSIYCISVKLRFTWLCAFMACTGTTFPVRWCWYWKVGNHHRCVIGW